MNTVTLSIIIPAYNCKTFLPACIDSILAQTFQDWELIVVDDGSTDGSDRVLDAYAEKDERIKVFHVPNGGVSSARNIGLQHASGSYVGFCDADDCVRPHMYETLLTQMQKECADLAQCRIVMCEKQDVNSAVQNETNAYEIYDGEAVMNAFFRNDIISSVCVKVFNKAMLDGLQFKTDYRTAEDGFFVYEYCLRAKRVICNEQQLYCYVWRAQSVTKEPVNEKTMDVFRLLDMFRQYHNENPTHMMWIGRWEAKSCLNYFNCCCLENTENPFQTVLQKRAKGRFDETWNNRTIPIFVKIRLFMVAKTPKVYKYLYRKIRWNFMHRHAES